MRVGKAEQALLPYCKCACLLSKVRSVVIALGSGRFGATLSRVAINPLWQAYTTPACLSFPCNRPARQTKPDPGFARKFNHFLRGGKHRLAIWSIHRRGLNQRISITSGSHLFELIPITATTRCILAAHHLLAVNVTLQPVREVDIPTVPFNSLVHWAARIR